MTSGDLPAASPAPMRRVVAILTAHNRRELTLACLRSYFSQEVSDIELGAVLVDDGSSDGTAEVVSREFPATQVVTGTGDLFWARGMATAEAAAMRSDPDYLLWLNDDVHLYPDALLRLMAVAETSKPSPVLIAGTVCDPETGAPTDGGLRRRDWHPMRFALVQPPDLPTAVDTVHGNVLLVPRATYRLVGNIDGGFAHTQADMDYGLRLGQRGGQNILIPGLVGTCAANYVLSEKLDPALSFTVRWRFLHSRKGRPLRSQIRYLRRHGGPFWPIFLLPPYIRLIAGLPFPDINHDTGGHSHVGVPP